MNRTAPRPFHALAGRLLLGTLLALLASTAVVAQELDDKARREIERMVGDGMLEALEARFKGERTPEQLRWLALANTNKAAQLRDPGLRFREFENAEKRFDHWLRVLEAKSGDEDAGLANSAAARLEYAGMILGRWAAPELDEFELTAGRRGDNKRLADLLRKARDQYELCRRRVEPLLKTIDAPNGQVDDKLLLTGLLDTIKRVDLDSRFGLAWTHLYLVLLEPTNAEARVNALREAERGFQSVLEKGVPQADTAARCYLGLAMTLREQQRYDPADQQFGLALQQEPSRALAAQIRYERAKAYFAAGKFDDARSTLHPLLEKNLDKLEPDDRPARFYLNLAHLWDAYGYLLEAQLLEKTAQDSAGREAILRRAEYAREAGIAAMNRLAARGGPWPGLVQLYVASTVRDLDPKKLTPAELLFSARKLAEEKKLSEAIDRLREADSRAAATLDLAADIVFELGQALYRHEEKRPAAEAFERYCRTYKNLAPAPNAATYAIQIRLALAETSHDAQDYEALADLLLYVLQTFPDHPQRTDYMWWLPLALQGAHRYAEAAAQFANVPPGSPHWEEAQYRRLMVRRAELDIQAASAPADLKPRAEKLAADLLAYATAAQQRAIGGKDPAAHRWAATARINAAELLISPEIHQPEQALKVLTDFELTFPEPDTIARVLAVRARALRALNRLDDSARVIDEYLKNPARKDDGSILAVIAQGLLDEIDNLEANGRTANAHEMALQAVPILEQLESWARSDPARAKHLKAISAGLARMYLLAGDLEKARKSIAALLFIDPQNGALVRLQALTFEALAATDKSQLVPAREAWSRLAADPDLKKSAPDRYWEARYHLLNLLLREGRAADVRKAIEQEKIWFPDLGGRTWAPRFEELLHRTASQPASAPTP